MEVSVFFDIKTDESVITHLNGGKLITYMVNSNESIEIVKTYMEQVFTGILHNAINKDIVSKQVYEIIDNGYTHKREGSQNYVVHSYEVKVFYKNDEIDWNQPQANYSDGRDKDGS